MSYFKLTALTAALLILSVPALSMTEAEIKQKVDIDNEDSAENIEKEIKQETTQKIGHDTSQTSIEKEIEEKAEQEEKEIRKGKKDKKGLFSALLNLF